MDELNFIETNYPLFQNGTSKRLIRHNFFSKIETELIYQVLSILMGV